MATKYRHKHLIETGPVDEPEKQLVNVFHKFGEREINGGALEIGLIQEGQASQSPTWFREETLRELFEALP